MKKKMQNDDFFSNNVFVSIQTEILREGEVIGWKTEYLQMTRREMLDKIAANPSAKIEESKRAKRLYSMNDEEAA